MTVEKVESDEPDCKGIFFRYSRSAYVSSHNSIEFRESYRLLKKRSCPGCDTCGFFWEDIDMAGLEDTEIEWPKDPCPGDLYEVRYIPGSYDYEGEYDGGSWALDKIECRFLPVPMRGREVLSTGSCKGCEGCNNRVKVGVPYGEYCSYFSCMSIELPIECIVDDDKPLAGREDPMKAMGRLMRRMEKKLCI
jgi:hypothetical protein